MKLSSPADFVDFKTTLSMGRDYFTVEKFVSATSDLRVMWWPFEQPPPAAYASSQELFPAAWNANIVSRFNITLSVQSGVIE